jgi:hypothetical protein
MANDVSPGLLPGSEIAYVELTSDTAITGASFGAGQTVLTFPACVFSGSQRIYIEVCFGRVFPGANQGRIVFNLSDSGTDLGQFGLVEAGSTAGAPRIPFFNRRFFTPSAASHTYTIVCWTNGQNGSVGGGAGGAGAAMPSYGRICVA